MDISAIRPGADFAQAIESEVAACEAVLVVIGRQWLTCAADGHRRLDDPHDFVRLEIASALSRDVLVIPLLVEGAGVPREQDLPDDLKPLARRHALEISDERWEYDAGRLIDTLEETLGKRSGATFARRRVRGMRQRWFEPSRYWRLFPVRLLLGLLVLFATLAPQIRLAYRPEPVKLEETGKFSPAEADSACRFSFNPATSKNDLWEGAEGFFQPFALGGAASAPFRARALEITSLGGKGTDPTTLLGARSPDGEWLNVESLSVGSDRLQIKVSGMGFVKVNGDDFVDPLGRMRKYPLVTILLAVVDAALLVRN
jgi:hypothetical protein